jgi:3-dehydroquinate synthase
MAVTSPEIIIGRGLLNADVLSPRAGRRMAVVLTQPGAGAHAKRVADHLACAVRAVIELPDGEAAKTLDVAATTYARLNAHGLTRDDTIVAVGGGAITDLGGFVAATYLRGIEAVYCPTTLLGAVDAAIGGKTGVNVEGKNLVGVFAHPSRIVIDVEVLEGLPPPLLRQGLAEALKAGMIGDARLVELLERHGLQADLAEVVQRAVDVKTEVVAEDFREAGRRAVLNYGHTIGHGIEMASGISHGEAVAVGMVAAGAVSEAVAGFDGAARQGRIIDRLGLPVNVRFDRRRVLDLIQLDKKRDASGVRMVLLESIEHPVVRTVNTDELGIGLDAITP